MDLSSKQTQGWLLWFLRGVLLLGFLLLFGRVAELQIIKGSYFRSLSEGNRTRRIPITAPRGRILARGGEVLVDNVQVKKRIVFNPDEGFQKLDDLTQAPEDEIITEWVRTYPMGKDFAHIGGYVGEVNEKESGKINPDCPEKGVRRQSMLVGRGGLEEEYECTLAGIDGEELVEVDIRGKKVRTLGRREPVPGEDLRTFIDHGLQIKLARSMGENPGGIVVMDPAGEVLALYSSPSFDPNLFVHKGNTEAITEVLNDKQQPLFNRNISGAYHPGSIYKPVVSLAALEEGKVDKYFTYEDTGVIQVNQFSYRNWLYTKRGGVEGNIGLVRAIARSTDTFFYKVGEIMGVDVLVEWSQRMGLDKKTGIDLPGEVAGLVPSPAWKEKVKGERWYLGNTYHMSIGQGDLAVTPVAINNAIAAIATGGILCAPQIADTQKCNDLEINSENAEIVKQGMLAACAPGGTGYPFFDFEPAVACKTGTAETSDPNKTHAWFTVFGPFEKPEIIATVLVEKGGEGSSVAAPIAKEVFDYWFYERLGKEIPGKRIIELTTVMDEHPEEILVE